MGIQRPAPSATACRIARRRCSFSRRATDNHVMPAHGLMFHHFHDAHRHRPGQGSVSAEQFAAMLRGVGRGRVIPAMEFLDRALAGRLREHHLCLTFDDNLRSQYDVALPVLEELNLTAFWFVNSSVMQGNIERMEVYRHFRNTQFGCVDDFYAAFFVRANESPFTRRIDGALRQFNPAEYLTGFPFYSDADRRFRFVRDEVLGPLAYATIMDAMIDDARPAYDVRAVARTLWMDDAAVRALHNAGHVIGLHSHTHPTRIERLGEDEQRYEYRANQTHVMSVTGEQPLAMSHPCNSYNATTLEILRDLEIKLGFRANMAGGFTSDLELPREDHANLLKRVAA